MPRLTQLRRPAARSLFPRLHRPRSYHRAPPPVRSNHNPLPQNGIERRARLRGPGLGGGALSHFLEHEWVLWEHRAPASSKEKYEDNMAKLCEFATVEDYWRLFNNAEPSEIFYDGKTKKKFKDRTVESFSLFKKGIKPEWEDKMNRDGAEWFCRKAFLLPQLDDFWANPTMGMVGGDRPLRRDLRRARGRQVVGLAADLPIGAVVPPKGAGHRRRARGPTFKELGPSAKLCKFEMRPQLVEGASLIRIFNITLL